MTRNRKNIIPFAAATFTLAFASMLPLAQAQTHGGGMDMKAMMKEGNDKMASMRMTGNHDVDFAMMMRMHHQSALPMAEAELKHGKDPEMKKMASKIMTAQKKEIAELDKFLAKHKK